MDYVDVIVIGAGVIGLAIGREVARCGLSVIIIEKEGSIGSGISSRSSEVIHSGIYYKPESYKAIFSQRGNELLYRYCEKKHVDYRKLGKLVVACNDEEVSLLHDIEENAKKNNVNDIRLIGRAELKKMEPSLSVSNALLCPSTGIIDSHGLMTALLHDFEYHNGILSLWTNVEMIEPASYGFISHFDCGSEKISLKSKFVVNAAGLGAQRIASLVSGIDKSTIPKIYFNKGCYFNLRGKSPFKKLIYPVPNNNLVGLGIHATLDLANQCRFGPDAEYVDDINYDVDSDKILAFITQIRRYFPSINANDLTVAYAGIRPKLNAAGKNSEDFMIQNKNIHGFENLIQLFGIESPGLTSSLAIAEYIASVLE